MQPAQYQQQQATAQLTAPPEQQAAPPPAQQTAAAGDSEAGDEGLDAELGAWLAGRLQRMQPGAELDEGSVRVLGALLDTIATRVLDEAQRVNAADTCDTVAGGGGAAAAQQQHQQHQQQHQQHKRSTLTSLDIHKALKRVLPGEPSDGRLRPYLPAEVKQAWHLDKQSLKRSKKQKQAATGAAAPAPPGAAPGGGKENAAAEAAAAAAAVQQQLQQ